MNRKPAEQLGAPASAVLLVLLTLGLLDAPVANAQPSPDPPEADGPDETPGPEVVRPTLVHPVQPQYPPEAWDNDVEGDVVLLLWVTEEGKVEAAEVVSTPGYGMELAAIVAAKKLVFSPARLDNEPVKVKIRYTFRFRKPERGLEATPPERTEEEAGDDDPRKKGLLKGAVIERGTGKPLVGVEVYVLDFDQAVLTDSEGHFETRPLTPGGYAITINATAHYPFETLERVEAGETVEVKYYVEPKRREKYKTVVWGSEGKAMVGRTTLEDAEIYEVPGTFGDPIRVVMLLPGVATGASGISYPIIRGVLPADTRYEVDGIQVPMLYHLIVGNSVVNPRYTTGITFQPGGYSVEYGQFPGGLIRAEGAPPPEEPVTFGDISILHASLLHGRPIADNVQAVAAGRYGTLGLIIEGLASNVVFRYWDYQSKVRWAATDKDTLDFLAFGAGNTFGEETPEGGESVIQLGFHRAAVRWRRSLAGAGWFQLALEGGREQFEPPPDEPQDQPAPVDGEPPATDPAPSNPFDATYQYAAVRAKASLTLVRDVELRFGGESALQDFGFTVSDADVSSPSDGVTLGSYTELEWTPGDWTLMPGVRVDHYRYGLKEGPRETSVDPRFAAGLEVTDWLTAKASAGVHHGPPRVTLVEGPVVIGPVPGLMGVGLEYGLSRSIQFASGLELKLPYRFEASLQGYYSLLDTALDFSLLNVPLWGACAQGSCDGEAVPAEEDEGPPPRGKGRSFGAEVVLRRRLGDAVFGWATYSLSRSERELAGFGTVPFAFDQTHMINAVLSWDVGRHWTLGSTFHFHTGRPYTPAGLERCPRSILEMLPPDGIDGIACYGEPFSERLPNFWRTDFRVQKREVFDTWHFDFYIDLVNVTFNKEVVGYELNADGQQEKVEILVFIPMIGLKGQF